MEKGPLLQVENIDVFYGPFQALWDVSLEVYLGEFVSLIGANDAGKTTLFNTVMGLIRPRKGRIKFKGIDITNYDTSDIVNLGLVQTPEDRRIFPSLSVEENLLMGSYTRRARVKKTNC